MTEIRCHPPSTDLFIVTLFQAKVCIMFRSYDSYSRSTLLLDRRSPVVSTVVYQSSLGTSTKCSNLWASWMLERGGITCQPRNTSTSLSIRESSPRTQQQNYNCWLLLFTTINKQQQYFIRNNYRFDLSTTTTINNATTTYDPSLSSCPPSAVATTSATMQANRSSILW